MIAARADGCGPTVGDMATDLYTARVTSTAGTATSDDGALSVDVHEPSELQGTGEGTNPEQLMAAALGSCLLESLRIATSSTSDDFEGASVEARVVLTQDGIGYTARYELEVAVPGSSDADAVLEQALSICPFTKTLDGSTLTVRLAA